MQHAPIIKQHCVSFFQGIFVRILRIVQQFRKPRKGREKFLRGAKRERSLEGRGVVDVRYLGSMGREFDREVFTVEVVPVVDVMK